MNATVKKKLQISTGSRLGRHGVLPSENDRVAEHEQHRHAVAISSILLLAGSAAAAGSAANATGRSARRPRERHPLDDVAAAVGRGGRAADRPRLRVGRAPRPPRRASGTLPPPGTALPRSTRGLGRSSRARPRGDRARLLGCPRVAQRRRGGRVALGRGGRVRRAARAAPVEARARGREPLERAGAAVALGRRAAARRAAPAPASLPCGSSWWKLDSSTASVRLIAKNAPKMMSIEKYTETRLVGRVLQLAQTSVHPSSVMHWKMVRNACGID